MVWLRIAAALAVGTSIYAYLSADSYLKAAIHAGITASGHALGKSTTLDADFFNGQIAFNKLELDRSINKTTSKRLFQADTAEINIALADTLFSRTSS